MNSTYDELAAIVAQNYVLYTPSRVTRTIKMLILSACIKFSNTTKSLLQETVF